MGFVGSVVRLIHERVIAELLESTNWGVFIMDSDVMFERKRDWCLYFTAETTMVPCILKLDMQTTQYTGVLY